VLLVLLLPRINCIKNNPAVACPVLELHKSCPYVPNPLTPPLPSLPSTHQPLIHAGSMTGLTQGPCGLRSSAR
jgi:hypothetical protein